MKKFLFSLLILTVTWGALHAEFLMPDEAFKPKASLKGSSLEVTIDIAKDIYLYEDRVNITSDSDSVAISSIDKPASEDHDGDQVFMHSPTLVAHLQAINGATGTVEVPFTVSFQGCSSQGLCYEPMEKVYTFSINVNSLSSSKAAEEVAKTNAPTVKEADTSSPKRVSETDEIAKRIASGNIVFIILSFLGFGLLLSLTPCVFPMIPILSGVIVSQGEGMTTKRAFFLSVVYVLAMSVAYTIAGILAGLFGSNLQAAFQAPWIIGIFSAIFVALSLSMFGLYELQMPNFIQSKLTKATENSSGIVGVAIMGFLSALIVGPCVAAPLAGALIYIGQTGDAVIGGIALFSLSIGMGIPLILVGTSAGKFMPKPGGWMEAVKGVFGVLLLGVAIWMLSRIVPQAVTTLLTAILILTSALYMGVFEPIKEGVHKAMMLVKALAFLFFIYALALLIGLLGGGSSIISPLSIYTAKSSVAVAQGASQGLSFTRVTTLEAFNAELAKAKGKPVMLDFYADWCTSCKEMEEVTFKDQKVINALKGYVLIQADITEKSAKQEALSKAFGVFGPPVTIFFDNEGNKIEGADVVGFKEPKLFESHILSLQ